MLLLDIARPTTTDASQTHECGQLKFSFICGSLSGKLHVGFSKRDCISSRSVSWTPSPKTRLNLGRTIVCRTPSKRLPHLALLPCSPPVGALRPLALKKRSSLSIQHRSHRSLSSTVSTAKLSGARFATSQRAPIFEASVTEGLRC